MLKLVRTFTIYTISDFVLHYMFIDVHQSTQTLHLWIALHLNKYIFFKWTACLIYISITLQINPRASRTRLFFKEASVCVNVVCYHLTIFTYTAKNHWERTIFCGDRTFFLGDVFGVTAVSSTQSQHHIKWWRYF